VKAVRGPNSSLAPSALGYKNQMLMNRMNYPQAAPVMQPQNTINQQNSIGHSVVDMYPVNAILRKEANQ